MFTKENTKQIKGIAILLMMAHHLFAFPDRVPYGMTLQTPFYISGMELTELIGCFGKICVSIYMFLGGYGLYMRLTEDIRENRESNRLGEDIARIYKAYWRVFLIFIPIAFIFFGNQMQYCANEAICNRYAEWKVKDFLMNFVGLSNSFNSEWWFLKSYLFALFEGYIFIQIFKNSKRLYLEMGSVILWSVLVMNVFPIIPFAEGYELLWNNMWYDGICLGSEYTVLFLIGIIFAKYEIFENWKNRMDKLRKNEEIVLALFLTGLVAYVRVFFTTVEFDVLLAPLFIFGCWQIIEKGNLLKKVFGFLGVHSTNMWLIHTFYCFYFSTFAIIVYGSNNAVVSYLVLLTLSLGSSILINKFWKIIERARNHCPIL